MFEEIKHAHLVGIGGIGMSAIAKLLAENNVKVSGSDLYSTEVTKKLSVHNIEFKTGHSSDNVNDTVDVLIYSSAVPESNVERVKARELGVRELSYAQMLGEITKQYSTIVVTGTHGKSTTTAMLGLILEEAGYDPTVLVGSFVPSFKFGNLRIGKGRFFVVEGCEYEANMLNLNPEMIILTNMEEDHLDFYRDYDHIKESFQQFVDKLSGKGMAISNIDDAGLNSLNYSRHIRYGSVESAEYFFKNRKTAQGSQTASVFRNEDEQVFLGDVTLQIPGKFNISNALAAISAGMELGIPFETCKKVLEKFTGIWRRFERVGIWEGVDVISDYGHHPTAISGTLRAAREFFPGRRIILVYQPHQHSRTKELFDDFVKTLPAADHLIIAEVYDVAGRNEDQSVSSRDLVDKIKYNDPAKDVQYASIINEAESQLRDLVKPNDVVIIMGAGDIDGLVKNIGL